MSCPQAHFQYRVDVKTLIDTPETVLQRMSFKILEKRAQVLNNLIDTKVQFKINGGFEQGVCKSIDDDKCTVLIANTQLVTIALIHLIL
tara:strand:+ start:2260 stop:2526 length:267 start_codon:yes stop_codon:yes gene_type:complete